MIARLLCWMFGHQPPVYAEAGWWSPGEEYGKVTRIETDGIGRVHAQVVCQCPRCDEVFVLCRIHLPRTGP